MQLFFGISVDRPTCIASTLVDAALAVDVVVTDCEKENINENYYIINETQMNAVIATAHTWLALRGPDLYLVQDIHRKRLLSLPCLHADDSAAETGIHLKSRRTAIWNSETFDKLPLCPRTTFTGTVNRG